jgi:hypothetical protein
MKTRVYLIAVPLMAMSDGCERSVEASSTGVPGLAKRPDAGPADTPNWENL